MNQPFTYVKMQSNNVPARTFTAQDLKDIENLKIFMSKATDVPSWNELREQAKSQFNEIAITAIDGAKKWNNSYDKTTKKRTLIGVRF